MDWTPTMDRVLREEHAKGKSWAEIASCIYDTFGAEVSVESARHRYRRLMSQPISSASEGSFVRTKTDLELEQERIKQRAIKQQDAEDLRKLAKEYNLRAELEALLHETIPQFPVAPVRELPKKVGKLVEESLLFMISDWHAYESVSAERMRGLNSYDSTIFGQRALHYVNSSLSIKQKLEKANWRFDRAVLGLNGDFVSGTIHELERHTDAPNIVMAVYGCASVLAEAIRDIATEFPQVDVFCTSGNHGRLPDVHRMQQKDPTRNWDTVIYLMAKEMLRDQANVEFFIPDSYSVVFEIEGWNFLQTHGHDIQMWNQIPWYGMKRQISSVSAIEAGRGQTIDYFLWGHFHSKTAFATATGESFINGSLIGGTEYTLQRLGLADKPSQWLLGVHREHGVSHRWAIDCAAPENAPGYNVHPWT